jgi:N-hydroxyarylamine O-acetyltransferase
MDTSKYLERINYTGNIAPGLKTLTELQEKHLLNIAFENLDIHYGIPIVLDHQKIADKIINSKRGGFCYELNGLFYKLLISLGFTTKMVSGRAYNRQKLSFGPEYDHLALITTIDGADYLVDVGFGEFTLNPLKIELGITQSDKRGNFKIERYDDQYLAVSNQAGLKWDFEYVFSTNERAFSEFAEVCRYHQTSAESHFTRNRLCSIATENGRITLTDDKLKITDRGKSTETAIIDEQDFAAKLAHYFSIEMNATPIRLT